MDELTVRRTRCTCHPETCGHWPYSLMLGSECITTGEKADCERLLALLTSRNTRAASGGLNEPFGNPEQFDVNEHSGNSRQLASLEQRAEDLLRVARNGWFETSDPVPHGAAIRAITAALANQQGVGGAKDTERLDWLAHHGAALRHEAFVGWFVLAPYHTGITTVDGRIRFQTAREAIDAAMSTQPAGDVGREGGDGR